ncbi:MAG: hypothetical protein KC736_02450 [Candidatus Moranbacteria bacterium]|nr:hypothetical protein [Candidatus Moranbacteria bacterium]
MFKKRLRAKKGCNFEQDHFFETRLIQQAQEEEHPTLQAYPLVWSDQKGYRPLLQRADFLYLSLVNQPQDVTVGSTEEGKRQDSWMDVERAPRDHSPDKQIQKNQSYRSQISPNVFARNKQKNNIEE